MLKAMRNGLEKYRQMNGKVMGNCWRFCSANTSGATPATTMKNREQVRKQESFSSGLLLKDVIEDTRGGNVRNSQCVFPLRSVDNMMEWTMMIFWCVLCQKNHCPYHDSLLDENGCGVPWCPDGATNHGP